MTGKITLAVVLSFFVFVAAKAEAKKGSGNNGANQVRLHTDLDPCCGNPEPQATGEAQRRITSKENRFQAEVEIPMPNGLGITVGNAKTADVRLILSRGGTDYTECRLVFDDIQQDTTGQLDAEYKLDLRNKKSRGSCTAGLPDIQTGDVATATVVINPADRTQDIDLLQGTFGASDD
jgi:hypothetical protein